MVERALEGWNLKDLDFRFIGNAGNLACSSGYDLGENARLVLLSVTEDENKLLKYPAIFQGAKPPSSPGPAGGSRFPG